MSIKEEAEDKEPSLWGGNIATTSSKKKSKICVCAKKGDFTWH